MNDLHGHKPLAAPFPQDALGKLAAYNVIIPTPEGITVHRLVQALARTPDDDDRRRRAEDIAAARGTATRLLDNTRPQSYDDPAGWSQWRGLLPHIDALVDHAPAGTDTDATVRLLCDTALFLSDQGAHPRALTYVQRCLISAQRLHHLDHTFVLNTRAGLAYVLRRAGDLQRAIPLLEHNLAEEERVLGADHPHTLQSRNNLASACQEAGDLGERSHSSSRPSPTPSACWVPATRQLKSYGPTSKLPHSGKAGTDRTDQPVSKGSFSTRQPRENSDRTKRLLVCIIRS
ncbi:hypothetical protein amrb99_07230 [Actinomadura sp. RB99]|uniref:tetratricopeptide repeat protein n=1 Tax=Actinomadura sp. RB99 TaxID=2691577 RepID=UPI001681FDEF|nr:tetratricopeptide repeat protein [Actinomadura sp. RB99]MBD2891816.1 hypothetical protein [Actinomadura sp. RB99]